MATRYLEQRGDSAGDADAACSFYQARRSREPAPYMTDDNSRFTKDDSALSPLGSETVPGRVALLGSFAPTAGDDPPIVHRIGASNDRSVLLGLGNIGAGELTSGFREIARAAVGLQELRARGGA